MTTSMDSDTTLGGALRQQREALGYSQRQAAAAVGVSQAAWQKWELDKAKPDIDRLEAVADFLGVGYEEAFAMWRDVGVAQMTHRRPPRPADSDRIAALERLVADQAAELAAMRKQFNSLTRSLDGNG